MNTITPRLEVDEPIRLNELDGEIDLMELLRSVLRVWKHWLIAMLVISLAFIALKLFQIINSHGVISYNKAIKLTFPGVEKSVYPNQLPFQIEDIIAPAIVGEVYENLDLAIYGLSIEGFRAAVMVEPYAPTYSLIVHRYNQQLSGQLSTVEVQALESQMSSELNLATSGGALISLTLEKNTLPDPVVAKILSEIPKSWAERAINNKGVLNLNIHLTSSSSLNDVLIENVDYLVVGDLLTEKMRLITNNMEKLLEFSGASTVRDPITGSGLADLQQKVNDLQYYVIDELMSPIRSLGLTKNRRLSLYYYQDKKRVLLNDLTLYREQATLVKQAFENYYPKQLSGVELVSGSSKGSASVITSLPDADVLEKLLSLSSNSKTEDYRQSLSEKWLTLNMKVAELNNQIAGVERTIAILNNDSEQLGLDGTDKGALLSLKKSHLERTKQSLPKILDQISGFLDVTQRIYIQLSIEHVGQSGNLYRSISNEPFYQTGQFNKKRELMILIAVLLISSIILIPALVIRNAMRRN